MARGTVGRGRGQTVTSYGNLNVARTTVLGFSRLLFMGLTASAAPLHVLEHLHDGDEAEGASLWVLYVASVVLVLLGGAFAGLTIALMGQDSIYLQVLARDPAEPQRRNARRVHELLGKGKHWVLVTLLLGNVIVNETLPVVLDRCLGGGVAAVVGSTVLIVIFGEILPQSVCVRYGLPIGGYMSKPVLLLMWLMAPVAWPTAKLLDWALGEDHGTVYKKSGLKTLVTLHRQLGDVSQRLNQDEVTIIGAVLDLKEKPVEQVMTPMDDVFVMSEDTVLNEETMDMILSAGYSRIPIHETGNPTNFIGMLLVKILITYDPEDCRRVKDFALATLPETRPETSCLDIINFFQEGKSHMVLVSEYPGEDHGALGVVTLEDVIEELIGEEIIDESDVYIDVHKAIRRLAPAPKARLQRRLSGSSAPISRMSIDGRVAEDGVANGQDIAHKRVGSIGQEEARELSSSPKTAMLLMRRSSTAADGRLADATVPVRANLDEVKQHLKHLGPSNPATNPKSTRSTTVKIKPGVVLSSPQRPATTEPTIDEIIQDDADETTGLLRPRLNPKDGTHALQQSYASTATAPNLRVRSSDSVPINTKSGGPHISFQGSDHTDHATQTSLASSKVDLAITESTPILSGENDTAVISEHSSPYTYSRRGIVRSGSITENIIESRGIRKVILETTSSTDDDDEETPTGDNGRNGHHSQVSLLPPAEVAEGISEESGEGNDEEDAGEAAASGSGSGGNGKGAQNHGGKKKNRRKKRKGGGKP